MASIVIGVASGSSLYTVKDIGGHWVRTDGAPKDMSKMSLWQAAMSIGETACAQNVSYDYLTDPTSETVTTGTLKQRALRASQYRSLLFVAFETEQSRNRISIKNPVAFVMAYPDSEGLYLDVI